MSFFNFLRKDMKNSEFISAEFNGKARRFMCYANSVSVSINEEETVRLP